MFLLLIAFVHVTNFLYLQLLHFCVVVLRALQIWEGFFYSQAFLSYTPSRHLAQPTFIETSLGADSSSLKVARLPTEVWNTDPAQSKFYLSVKVLKNTISTSSMFWTYSLIAVYVAKCMSYRLCYRRTWWIWVYKHIWLLFINA